MLDASKSDLSLCFLHGRSHFIHFFQLQSLQFKSWLNFVCSYTVQDREECFKHLNFNLTYAFQLQVAGGSLSLPLGIKSSQSFAEWLHEEHESSLVSVSAGCTYCLDPVSELLTVRGLPPSKLNRLVI